MKKEITPENMSIDEVRTFVDTANGSKDFEKLKEVIRNLSMISSKNVPVFIGAGNEGANELNLFGLAEGVNVVGSTGYSKNSVKFFSK